MNLDLSIGNKRKNHDEINSQMKDLAITRKLDNFFVDLTKVKNSNDIYKSIEKLVKNEPISYSEILSQITKHYYNSPNDNRIFKQALVLLEQSGTLKKLFEINNNYVSDDACEKILKAYIRKDDDLDLSDEHILELPDSIGQLNNLKTLNLLFNRLSQLPNSIGQLTNLNKLSLRNNQFSQFPDCIAQLNNLKCLEICNNRLTELPDSIGQLSNLTTLNLTYNELLQIPDSIGQLNNLKELFLFDNCLSQIPDSIGELNNLKHLDISYNQLLQIPESIGQLNNLEDLFLYSNRLSQIPDSIVQLNNLENLFLFNNNLSQIPDSIGQLVNLHNLSLTNNQLESLPDSISQLTNLRILYVGRNQLTQIPSSIGHLNNLYDLSIENNQLSQIPDSILQNQNLRHFFYEGNPITEHIARQRNRNTTFPIPNRAKLEYDNKSLESQIKALKELSAQYNITKDWENPSIWKELDKPENNSFKMFLDKIWKTKDANKSETTKKQMLETVMNIFDKMEQNPDFCKICFNIAEESIESCGDRVALGLIQMQIAQKGYPDNIPSVRDLYEYEKIMLKADIVFELANNKLKTLNYNTDEIEIYLKYFFKLKDDLGIELVGMLYGADDVTNNDIQIAKNKFEEISNDNIFERLLNNPIIQKRFEKEFDDVQNRDEFDTNPKDSESTKEYNERLKIICDLVKTSKIEILKVSFSQNSRPFKAN